MRLPVVICLLCIAASALAQSGPLALTPAAGAEVKGQESATIPKPTANYRQGTKESPLIVEVLPSKKTDEDTARITKDSEDRAQNERVTRFGVWASVILSFLLVIANGALFVYTRKAANAAKDSADAAKQTALTIRDTAERQLRAYVSVETYVPTDVDKRRMDGKYGLLVKNRGQTPAHKVRSWMAYTVREFPLAGPLTSNMESGSVAILAPAEEQVIINDWPRVSEEDIAAVVAGSKAAYIFGEVLYEDVFGTARHTRFRLFQSGKGVSHQRLANYPEGNEAS